MCHSASCRCGHSRAARRFPECLRIKSPSFHTRNLVNTPPYIYAATGAAVTQRQPKRGACGQRKAAKGFGSVACAAAKGCLVSATRRRPPAPAAAMLAGHAVRHKRSALCSSNDATFAPLLWRQNDYIEGRAGSLQRSCLCRRRLVIHALMKLLFF